MARSVFPSPPRGRTQPEGVFPRGQLPVRAGQVVSYRDPKSGRQQQGAKIVRRTRTGRLTIRLDNGRLTTVLERTVLGP